MVVITNNNNSLVVFGLMGMAQLGPAMAFETLGKILLVGLCGLTHYKRLELLATLAVTTVIVDFLIFMR